MTVCRFLSLSVTLLVLGGVLAPVLPAEDVQSRLAQAGGPKQYTTDALVVLDAKEVSVRPGGIGVARHHRVVKILRNGAIRSQSVQRFTYDPHTNRLDLEAIRVRRADGTVVEVALDPPVDQPQPSHLLFWGSRQRLVQLPRLAVGDAVETITVLTGFNVAYLRDDGTETPELNALGEPLQPPVAGHWHDEVHFWSSLPVLEQRYTVRMPRDKPLQYEIYGGELQSSLVSDGDHLVYSFWKRNLTPFEREPGMEPLPNVAPKLILATLPDWESKGRWLHAVSEPQLELDDDIRAKVKEIIAPLETDLEKWTALNHWVAENIRYSGTTRGMAEGYTIHDVRETFRDRAGVCKDKAGMLCGMLRAAGYTSWMVMTMARQRVDRIPADQFNHAVTCVQKADGSLLLLDPTWMPKSRDNWSTLEPLQHVVYGTPGGEKLSRSPYFAPDENQAVWRARSRIDAGGNLTTAFVFTGVGAPEGRLRRTLSGMHPERRPSFFDRTARRLAPNARVEKVGHTDPDDFSGPLKIQCKLAADHFALGDHSRRFLSLPMMQTVLGDRTLYDLFGKTGPKTRKYGVALLATRLARFKDHVELPPGWKVVSAPEAVSLDGPSASLEFEISTAPGEIKYSCELQVKRWVIPPEEYANFKEVMEAFEKLTGPVIVCEVEERP